MERFTQESSQGLRQIIQTFFAILRRCAIFYSFTPQTTFLIGLSLVNDSSFTKSPQNVWTKWLNVGFMCVNSSAQHAKFESEFENASRFPIWLLFFLARTLKYHLRLRGRCLNQPQERNPRSLSQNYLTLDQYGLTKCYVFETFDFDFTCTYVAETDRLELTFQRSTFLSLL